jgi:hypothetical protein
MVMVLTLNRKMDGPPDVAWLLWKNEKCLVPWQELKSYYPPSSLIVILAELPHIPLPNHGVTYLVLSS